MLQIEVRHLRRSSYLQRAHELLDRVGLAEFVNRFPDELSGGMNQRAAICRALIHDPDLLIMDEPFGALDAMTRDQMAVCTGNLILVDYVTESPNVNGDDRAALLLPDPARQQRAREWRSRRRSRWTYWLVNEIPDFIELPRGSAPLNCL
jgi:ABC-type iron transport system FetAB ATPase subunit